MYVKFEGLVMVIGYLWIIELVGGLLWLNDFVVDVWYLCDVVVIGVWWGFG